jgi:hypothetical protein
MFSKLVLIFGKAISEKRNELRSNTKSKWAVLLLYWIFAQSGISWCLFWGHSHTSDVDLFIYLFIYLLTCICTYLSVYLLTCLLVCLFSYAQLSNSNLIPDRSKALTCVFSRASKLVDYVETPDLRSMDIEAAGAWITTQLHLMSTLRMNGSVSTLPLRLRDIFS